MQETPRFGIGINDERIPSGLLGKTTFGAKFEQSIRSPMIDRIFTVLNKLTTSDEVLRVLAQPKWNPFKLAKEFLDFAGVPIDKIILHNNTAMKLALFGKNGALQHRSALLGLILDQFQQYIASWRTRQQQKIPVPRIHRRIKPPAKTYEGWKACQNEIYPEWHFYPPKGEFVKILATDTMTPKERIFRIIQGKETDRVGFGPNWNFAPCFLGGSNIWEFCYDGIATGLASVNTWIRTGGCDFLPIASGIGSYAVPLPDIHSRYYYKWSLPNDASFPQFIEESLIKSYDDLYNYGLSHQAQEITKRLMQDTWVMFRELIYSGKVIDRYFHPIKDQFYTYAAGMISSMDLLPMARGLVPFSRDVRKNPELIAEAFEFMGKPLADMMI